MEDILEIIKGRRTIRNFLPKFVEWEKISRILEAGREAPSSGNLQNWKFIVVIDLDLKRKLAEAALQQYEIVKAMVLIVVCGEPKKAERYYGSRGEDLYTTQNCAAAIQNMLLEAYSLGLGTRWIGAFDEEKVKQLLKIPEEIKPQAIIAVGYPKEIPERPPRFPLESLVYFNEWRNRLRDPSKYFRDYSLIVRRKLKAFGEYLKKSFSKTKEEENR